LRTNESISGKPEIGAHLSSFNFPYAPISGVVSTKNSGVAIVPAKAGTDAPCPVGRAHSQVMCVRCASFASQAWLTGLTAWPGERKTIENADVRAMHQKECNHYATRPQSCRLPTRAIPLFDRSRSTEGGRRLIDVSARHAEVRQNDYRHTLTLTLCLLSKQSSLRG
jgi:hypothetical protein